LHKQKLKKLNYNEKKYLNQFFIHKVQHVCYILTKEKEEESCTCSWKSKIGKVLSQAPEIWQQKSRIVEKVWSVVNFTEIVQLARCLPDNNVQVGQ